MEIKPFSRNVWILICNANEEQNNLDWGISADIITSQKCAVWTSNYWCTLNSHNHNLIFYFGIFFICCFKFTAFRSANCPAMRKNMSMFPFVLWFATRICHICVLAKCQKRKHFRKWNPYKNGKWIHYFCMCTEHAMPNVLKKLISPNVSCACK